MCLSLHLFFHDQHSNVFLILSKECGGVGSPQGRGSGVSPAQTGSVTAEPLPPPENRGKTLYSGHPPANKTPKKCMCECECVRVWVRERVVCLCVEEQGKDRAREIEREWGSSSFLSFYLKLVTTCCAFSLSTLETIQKTTTLHKRVVCVS